MLFSGCGDPQNSEGDCFNGAEAAKHTLKDSYFRLVSQWHIKCQIASLKQKYPLQGISEELVPSAELEHRPLSGICNLKKRSALGRTRTPSPCSLRECFAPCRVLPALRGLRTRGISNPNTCCLTLIPVHFKKQIDLSSRSPNAFFGLWRSPK